MFPVLGGRVYGYELPLRTKNRSVRYGLVSASIFTVNFHARAPGTTNHENAICGMMSEDIAHRGHQGQPHGPKVWGWGSGGRVYFQKVAGSRNQNSRQPWPAPDSDPGSVRMEADGGQPGSTHKEKDAEPAPRAAELNTSCRKNKKMNHINKGPFHRKSHFHMTRSRSHSSCYNGHHRSRDSRGSQRREEKSAGIPVVFLTAKTDALDEIRGLKLGAVEY